MLLLTHQSPDRILRSGLWWLVGRIRVGLG